MAAKPASHLPGSTSSPRPENGARLKIYFLPNLMTAGNLFCGFLALTKIVEADTGSPNFDKSIYNALFLILLACVFDMLDGRVARMGGSESPFGREFDSLADIVSFGAAPAFLVHRIVLADVFPQHHAIGWFLASVYLICGAFRLARFNCLAAMNDRGNSKEFLGFPIPAAAGMVASLTLLLLWLNEKDFPQTKWRFVLPVIMLFLSAMMVSEVKYPSFKSLDFRAKRSFFKMLIIVLVIGLFIILWEQVLPIAAPTLFSAYLLYGFIRPRLPRRTQHAIEDEDEDEEEGEAEGEHQGEGESGRAQHP
jgi:CDP-diacylglycerol--serine O-phosphatidyltransferase